MQEVLEQLQCIFSDSIQDGKHDDGAKGKLQQIFILSISDGHD